MTGQFVHLHNHTEYSLLDGAARVQALVDEAVAAGQPAIAITDHGNLHGAYDFYTRATRAGIKPIIGMEAYVAPGSRFDKERVRWGTPEQKEDDVSGGGAYTHMTIWARNAEGLRNLIKLSSRAYSEGFLNKPRVDRELLSEHAAGLAASTGCPGGEVQTRFALGQYDEGVRAAADFRDIFGEGLFFLELMDHGAAVDSRVRGDLVGLARHLNLPPLVTNDLHYVKAGDAAAHDSLLCVQTGAELSQEKRFRFDGSGYYLKTAEEMRAIGGRSGLWELGCKNTVLFAETVDPSGMFESYDLMPRFDVPEGYSEDSWLDMEAQRGLLARFHAGPTDRHVDQLKYELKMIAKMGFSSYFLVVADFIGWAKRNGIRVGPGRGSAAGSLVAYALGITDLDPIEHGLIFERFLNPERVSMPDMDIDFDDRRRHEVIQYVTEKYGADKVAMIGTYGRIKAKNAVKDAARVLGKGYSIGDRITKAFPPNVMGFGVTLDGIFNPEGSRYDEAAKVREMYQTDSDVREVLDTAKGLEGLVRQMGVHAAGVIMSSEPITDYAPTWTRPSDGQTITQWDFPTCEELGLMKMDFLGLRNLTIITDTLEGIVANRQMSVNLDAIPLDDPATFELLARGDTLGVFQLDGGPMRTLLKQMRPTEFEDITAVVALYRPGPMGVGSHTKYARRKNGQEAIEGIHPELEEPLREILAPTYGLIVYQEQVMRAAQVLAGYSLAKADILRKAMGKKKREVLEKEFVPFRDGCRANGYSDEAIQAVWDVLVPFADYAFNKAHAACYALIAYRTAWLKVHFPAEYMAAVLTSVDDDKAKSATYLAECRRMGLKVKAPDVNTSTGGFTPTGEAEIRFGLEAILGIGENVVAAIVRERSAGRYASLPQFLSRVPELASNKRAIESLIKAGALDSMGVSRGALAEVAEPLADAVKAGKSLYPWIPPDAVAVELPARPGWAQEHMLAAEREMLGLYVSGHPLDGQEALLEANAEGTLAELEDVEDDTEVTVCGLVSAVEAKTSKRGNAWARVTLEDLTGIVETVWFGRAYEDAEDLLALDQVVVIRGRLEDREGERQIVGMTASRPEQPDPWNVSRPPESPPEEFRVLVTGSRRWSDEKAVHEALERARGMSSGRRMVVVHGACRTGADAIADAWADKAGVLRERHWADWDECGKAAGPIRNEEMVGLGADLCLAFILDASRGASHAAGLAEEAGIMTVVFEASTESVPIEPFVVHVPYVAFDVPAAFQLRDILERHPGDTPVDLTLTGGPFQYMRTALTVSRSADLEAEVIVWKASLQVAV